MSHSLVIAGAFAQKPKIAGHTWVLLQYLLGFRRLGWKTLFVDYLEPSLCVDEAGQNCANRRLGQSPLRPRRREVLRAGGRLCPDRPGRREPHRHAPVTAPRASGPLGLPVKYHGLISGMRKSSAVPRGESSSTSIRDSASSGMNWACIAHSRATMTYVTIGLNIGRPDCTIPTCGLDWIVTPQPIVLEWWPRSEVRGESFTTIASWRGAYGPVESHGKSYGLRVHQFRRSWTCPGSRADHSSSPSPFTQSETRDLALLSDKGWSLVDPRIVAGDPLSYRNIHRTLSGRVLGGERHVRPESRRMDQRSEPLLPGERQTGTGTGDGFFATLSRRARGSSPTRRSRRPSRAWRRSRDGPTGMRGRPGPWRRSISIPIKSWLGSCKSWAWPDPNS